MPRLLRATIGAYARSLHAFLIFHYFGDSEVADLGVAVRFGSVMLKYLNLLVRAEKNVEAL